MKQIYGYISPLLSGSLKTTSDDKLLLELARRGDNLSSLREKEDIDDNAGATDEIVKIG